MEKVVNHLNILLADLNVFYRKLQNYHWNIEGDEFFWVHEKLEEYYNAIHEQIDEIAEHILMVRFGSQRNMGRFTEGFVAATLLFCVGSMAVMGSLEAGINQNYSILISKGVIDGVSAILLRQPWVSVCFSQ